MLIFWLAASSETIRSTIGVTLRHMRPNIPEHRFVEVTPGVVIEPEPGDIVLCCGM